MKETTGIVYNIQRYTIHDGPGIRTEVFLKGCPMHCKWCSNPESIHPQRELGVYPDKCIGLDQCGSCLNVCSRGGAPLLFNKETGKIGSIDRSICIGCMKCTDECFLHALKSWGEVMTVDQVMRVVLADRSYFQRSGGGITLNGGEVTVQWQFSVELLKASKQRGINTCVETSMQCKPEVLQEFYPYTDLMITDIKHMDTEVHRKYTGGDNARILQNIEQTVEAGMPLVIRVPVIPGINNDEENITNTAKFIAEKLHNKVLQVQLLPYRKMGTEKYASLERAYPMGDDYAMPPREVWEKNLLSLRDLMQSFGVPAVAGSNTRMIRK